MIWFWRKLHLVIKSNIFHILEIQVPLWLVKVTCDDHVFFFSALDWRFLCKAWTSFYLEDWNPLPPKDQRGILFCYKICCSCFSSQKQPIGSSLSLLVCVPFSLSVFMDSTPPTSKRIKTRVVRSRGCLEGWFSGDNELIEKYRFETSRKLIKKTQKLSLLVGWIVKNWMKWEAFSKNNC